MDICLTKERVHQLIEYKLDKKPIDDDEFALAIENSECWQEKIHVLTYLISHVLEKNTNYEYNVRILDCLYKWENEMSLVIEEMDENFVNYLIQSSRSIKLTLEQELVQVQEQVSGYQYGQKFRS